MGTRERGTVNLLRLGGIKADGRGNFCITGGVLYGERKLKQQ